jgi:hypothetical protein
MGAPRFLEQYGDQIARNGWEVIPIRPGTKRPYGDEWQKHDPTPAGVAEWVKKGKGAFGIGIMARHAPAVDIDCHDADIVRQMIDFTEALVGPTLHRVGLPPKTLLVYRSDEPFPKVQTSIYLDDSGRNVKLEVLADGQQFVAAHIHPDTGKPYRWIGKGSPLNTKLEMLPTITQEQAEQIRNEFDRLAKAKGWQVKSKALQRLAPRGPVDDDDPFAGVVTKPEITDGELRDKLLMVPASEDYDQWFHIGMALYHQYDGSDYALQLWHEWSATAPNYEPEILDKKWPTFEIGNKGRSPITARFIIKQANEEESRLRTETLQEVKLKIARLNADSSISDLTAVCDEIKHIAFSPPVREMLTGLVKDAFKRVTGTAARIGAVRDMIRYENPDNRRMPPWLKPFVYCTFDERFYNTATRTALTHKAFDSAFGRFVLTKKDVAEGRASPEQLPSHLALHQFQIPIVFNRMYLPGMDTLFTHAGVPYVNTFSDEGYPEVPGALTPFEKRAVEIVDYHFEHLIRNPRDRRLFKDWLAYVVQHPGQRINWAILIQGTEGDGKSFFSDLLKAVLGWENVNAIQGDALEEKYTPWAEKAMVCFIEDVRLHGNNRFAAINRLKPFITNTAIPVRRMNVDIYQVVNTMSYLMTSNMKDAIPAGEEDSRYFPIFSQFQSRQAIQRFKEANPDYYSRLWGTLEYAGALRKHFLEHEIGKDFDPNERAPVSSSRAEMVALNRSEEDEALADSLTDSRDLDYCEILLDSTKIAEEFTGRDAVAPYGKALNRLLSTNGFTLLGRFKVDNKPHRFWSRHPQIWATDDQERLSEQIREYLDPKGL